MSFFVTSCKKEVSELYFEGPEKQNAMLYKIQTEKNNEIKYVSLHGLSTQTKYLMNPGTYLIANECTSYQFVLYSKESMHIRLNTFQIKFDDSSLEKEKLNNRRVSVQCSSKITGEKTTFLDKDTFYILPGQNNLTISGTDIHFNSSENEVKNFSIHLSPLKLISPIENDQTQFFVQPVKENLGNFKSQNILQSGVVNQFIWLYPGKYAVEINGTKLNVSVEANTPTNITLGRIRILPPKNFLMQERTKSGQPIFAYINQKVLFSLDKDYAVFPGKYSINLDNSEMEEKVEINTGAFTKVQTYAAQVDPPSCPENEKQQNCAFLQKVFIHYKDQPFVISKVPLGVPFLVFLGEYQYSIEGMDGIMKNLPISSDSIRVEQIGKIKLKWKLSVASNNLETRKIYIEPSCCGLIGKSDDLNSYRPRELLLPQGEYVISYFVRQDKGPLKRNVISAHISSQKINEVQIPIYASSNQNINVFLENDEDSEKPQAPTTLTPIAP